MHICKLTHISDNLSAKRNVVRYNCHSFEVTCLKTILYGRDPKVYLLGKLIEALLRKPTSLNNNFILLSEFMSDLITSTSHRQAVNLNSHRLINTSFKYNRND